MSLPSPPGFSRIYLAESPKLRPQCAWSPSREALLFELFSWGSEDYVRDVLGREFRSSDAERLKAHSHRRLTAVAWPSWSDYFGPVACCSVFQLHDCCCKTAKLVSSGPKVMSSYVFTWCPPASRQIPVHATVADWKPVIGVLPCMLGCSSSSNVSNVSCSNCRKLNSSEIKHENYAPISTQGKLEIIVFTRS